MMKPTHIVVLNRISGSRGWIVLQILVLRRLFCLYKSYTE